MCVWRMVWRDRRLLWALIQGRGKILRSSLVFLSSRYGLLPAPCAGYSKTHSLAFESHYTFKRVFKHLTSGCKLHRSLKVTYGNAAHQEACAVFQIWPNALQGRPFSQLPNAAYVLELLLHNMRFPCSKGLCAFPPPVLLCWGKCLRKQKRW